MASKNTERFVNIGDRQFFDYRAITGVQPVEESTERDDFAQMMNDAGLFKKSVVLLENGDTATSTVDVETIMQRIDAAKCVDCEDELGEVAHEAVVNTMNVLASKVESALSNYLPQDDLVIVRNWLRECAEATQDVHDGVQS